MVQIKKTILKPSTKLEIVKRIFDGRPVSPLIDDMKPDEILHTYRFVMEKAIDFARAVKGPDFSKNDFSEYMGPLELDQGGHKDSNRNLISALQKSKKQIDQLAAAAHKFALPE